MGVVNWLIQYYFNPLINQSINQLVGHDLLASRCKH